MVAPTTRKLRRRILTASFYDGTKNGYSPLGFYYHRLPLRSARRTKGPNIPHRGWRFRIHKHPSPRGQQPQLLLVLKRTHGCQHSEMMMQRGHTHVGPPR